MPPGRDPIVTRILWLRGLEPQNQNAYCRDIYIHGTPEERNIGLPMSYGCVRMRSRDVIQLYNTVGLGAEVTIVNAKLHDVDPAIPPPGGIVARNERAIRRRDCSLGKFLLLGQLAELFLRARARECFQISVHHDLNQLLKPHLRLPIENLFCFRWMTN